VTAAAPIAPVVVAGLGNVLMGDDGVGVHLVRELGRPALENATLLDVGVAVLHALPFVERAANLVLLDAMDGGRPPGTLYARDGSAAPRVQRPLSVHSLDLLSALRLLSEGRRPGRTLVVGIQPAVIECRMGLSPALRAMFPALAARVRGIAHAWRLGLGADDLGPAEVDGRSERLERNEPASFPVYA
jgi:hydrogenase maturation protease